MRRRLALAAALALLAGGCASAYAPETLTGGFSHQELSATVLSVYYGGNGYTSEETVQTYWLYHCAELTLQKGYDGFTLLDEMKLTRADGGLIRAQYVPAPKPWLQARIRLLRAPLPVAPGRTFDARALKAMLEPYVTGPKCDGNVCPHVHKYLYPDA